LKKDKITVALLWPKYDGGVTSVNDLVLGLDKERFEVMFIYLSGYGTQKNLLEEAGRKVFYLSNIELLKAFRFSILFKLVGILKRHNVDIIHCHAHKPTVYGTIAAILSKTPVVIAHVHGTDRTANIRRKLTNLVLFRKIDRFLPVAQAVKEDVLKSNWLVSSEKLSVLDNSIDYQKFAEVSITQKDTKEMLGLPLDAFVFGTVARLSPNKGQVYLIKAFEKVKQTLHSAHLVFAGDGRIRQELEKEAEKTGFSDSIHFLGRRDNIAQIYKAMDVFVLPSIGSEGMPRVLLEAMAAGVPCIGTNIGGTPEVLCTEEVGYVVQPRDCHALTRAMIRLAKMDDKDHMALCERAKDRVRSCYAHNVARAKLSNIYQSTYVSSRAEIQEV
jgi:glycosyltransferase involved in cell wall biosynthesis